MSGLGVKNCVKHLSSAENMRSRPLASHSVSFFSLSVRCELRSLRDFSGERSNWSTLWFFLLYRPCLLEHSFTLISWLLCLLRNSLDRRRISTCVVFISLISALVRCQSVVCDWSGACRSSSSAVEECPPILRGSISGVTKFKLAPTFKFPNNRWSIWGSRSAIPPPVRDRLGASDFCWPSRTIELYFWGQRSLEGDSSTTMTEVSCGAIKLEPLWTS